MGNALGRRRRAKVMKINGETLKLKTPIRASEVLKNYPTFVLLESESVKRFGLRATPLEPQQELKPKKIYFLLQLPKLEEEKVPRRVRSSVHMTAKDRLECLKLSRRAISDISIARPPPNSAIDGRGMRNSGPLQVKVRLPRAEVAKIVEESKDGVDVAEKIMNLCRQRAGDAADAGTEEGSARERREKPILHCNRDNSKRREKHVSFMPMDEGEIKLEEASHLHQTCEKKKTKQQKQLQQQQL